MTYIYPRLKSENNAYIENNRLDIIRRFRQYGINSIEDLEKYDNKTVSMLMYLDYYDKLIPVGNNHCVVNRISWIFEKAFTRNQTKSQHSHFDYSILKCGTEYSKDAFKKILTLYKKYNDEIDKFHIVNWNKKNSDDDVADWLSSLRLAFQIECEKICSNEDELCDIILDICYSKERSKQFAWEICGSTIIRNLLRKNNYTIHYPLTTKSNGEFAYCGLQFNMCEKEVEVK